MQKTLIFSCLAFVLVLGQGCVFNRTVANEQVRNLDTSFIRPGQTTAIEVLNRLGPPPPLPDIIDQQNKYFTDDFVRYACHETRRTEFRLTQILFLPFLWSDTQAIYETMITFDNKGVVKEVIKTQRKTIRPPFKNESSRPPLVCKQTTAKGTK